MYVKNQFARSIGTAVAVLVLLAVPAFAISFADVSVFSPSTNLNPSQVANAGNDGTILNGWQFTCYTRQPAPTKPTRRTQPPKPPTKPTKKTDHTSKHTGH